MVGEWRERWVDYLDWVGSVSEKWIGLLWYECGVCIKVIVEGGSSVSVGLVFGFINV